MTDAEFFYFLKGIPKYNTKDIKISKKNGNDSHTHTHLYICLNDYQSVAFFTMKYNTSGQNNKTNAKYVRKLKFNAATTITTRT